MNINEKIEKETKKLEELKAQREKVQEKINVLDEKIEKVENEIQRCNNILYQEKFNEVDHVLSSNGLTLDEIINAIQSGDVSSLQKQIEKKKEETTTEEDNKSDDEEIQ